MRINATVIAGLSVPVQAVEQLGAGECLPGVLCQGYKQVELCAGKLYLFSPPLNPVPVDIDLQITCRDQPRLAHSPPHPAQDYLHSGNQLAGGEWFGNVIICTQLQTDQTVGLVYPGGEHDDGNIRFAADSLANLQPIHTRQVEVQYDQVRFFLSGDSQGVVTFRRGDHPEVPLFQVIPGKLDDLWLVVYDQY